MLKKHSNVHRAVQALNTTRACTSLQSDPPMLPMHAAMESSASFQPVLSTQGLQRGHAPWLELSWLTRASEGDAGCGAEPVLPEAVGVPKSIRFGALGARCSTFGGAAKALSPGVPFCMMANACHSACRCCTHAHSKCTGRDYSGGGWGLSMLRTSCTDKDCLRAAV